MSEKQTADFTLRHEWADDYILRAATGISGGQQPQGNFKLDFVIDHNPEIKRENYEINNSEGRRTSIQFEDEAVREHVTGVTMSSDDAFSAACWLLAELVDTNEEEIHKLISEEYSTPSAQ